MTDHHHNENGFDRLPPDLAALDARLGELGRQDRLAASDALEDRIFARTAPLLRETPAPAVVYRFAWRSPLRLAAAVGLSAVGVAGAIWLSTLGQAGGSQPVDVQAIETELEAWLTDENGMLASGLLSDEFATVHDDLALLEFQLYDPWFGDDLSLIEESL